MDSSEVQIPSNPGGFPDIPDSRDLVYGVHIGAATEPFDWNKGYDIEEVLASRLKQPGFQLPTNNQGNSSSCGGQAFSKYYEVLHAIITGKYEQFSAKFPYAQVFVPGGGSRGRDLVRVLQKQGCVKEIILPSYENGTAPSEAFMERASDITLQVRQFLDGDIVVRYGNVPPSIDAFAQAIRDNYGIVIGLDGSNNGTWRTAFPEAPDTREWGHWLYAGKARLINGHKYIGVKESWGDQVGQHGWQWLGEDFFTSGHMWPAWTIVIADASQNVTPVTSDVPVVTDNTEEKISLIGQLLNLLRQLLSKVGSYFSSN